MAFAQAGYLPCVQAFAVDQFDEEDENENRAKGSFFNWWNCFSTAGILAPLLVLAYIQDNLSWELGFGIPAVTMCFSLVVFLSGIRTYRFRKTGEGGSNPFVRIYRVFARAAKNRRIARVTKEETNNISDYGAHIGYV